MLRQLEKDRQLCLRCHHYRLKHLSAYYGTTNYGYKRYVQAETIARCNYLDRTLQKIRQRCKHFLDRRNLTLDQGGDRMVKLKDIVAEGERIDLKDLPREAELKAVSEKTQAKAEGKSGGLVITFSMRDKRTFPQKYSPVSGAVLVRALKKLKVKDTEELQKDWFVYELTAMRIGLPRMIPVKKVS